MPALTDAEILAGLPEAARKKIDNAFEALAQSLPSDKERLILYRVVTALKLNPTDTHFSVMAAMHYYLQLYQVIPDKIVDAGGSIIAAGQVVDVALRKTLAETLVEHTNALNAQSEMFAQKTQADLTRVLGNAAQTIAENVCVHEKQKSLVQAVCGVSAFAVVTFVAGVFVANRSLDLLVATGSSFAVGLISGAVFAYLVIPKPRNDEWTHRRFIAASLAIELPDKVMLACSDVLVRGAAVGDAAWAHDVSAAEVQQGIKKFLQQQ